MSCLQFALSDCGLDEICGLVKSSLELDGSNGVEVRVRDQFPEWTAHVVIRSQSVFGYDARSVLIDHTLIMRVLEYRCQLISDPPMIPTLSQAER